jgi:hypothetical protein
LLLAGGLVPHFLCPSTIAQQRALKKKRCLCFLGPAAVGGGAAALCAMPPAAQASTRRAVVVLSLSREERASLEGLRRTSDFFVVSDRTQVGQLDGWMVARLSLAEHGFHGEHFTCAVR